MKRFFTKKSVALIFTTILLVGFFSFFNVALAEAYRNQDGTLIYKYQGVEYYFQGGSSWRIFPYSTNPANGDEGRYSTNYMVTNLGMPQSVVNESAGIHGSLDSTQTINNFDVQSGSSQTVNVPPTPTTANQVPTTSTGDNSMLGKIGSWVKGAASGVVALALAPATAAIQGAILVAAFVLSIAGMILDFSVKYTIYGEGFANMSSTIHGIWTLLRDIANICFIFILLYAAIQQIISGSASKKILTSVIISAVLINFSLFATRIVIDAGNIVASSIYNQISISADSGNALSNIFSMIGLQNNSNSVDLSGRIMDGLGLKTIFSLKGNADEIYSIMGVGGVLTSVLKLAMFLVTTWVFYILAALLIGRYIMLIILMASSPIGFVGEVIPYIGGVSKKWQESLINQVLMAPTLMFFLFLTIRVSQALSLQSTRDPMVLIFNFFIVAFLLKKTVDICKDLGGTAAKIVDGVAKGLAVAGAAVVAAPALVGAAGALAPAAVAAGEAAAAGQTGLAAASAKWGTRLGMGLKSIPSGITQLAKGEQDKTGILGFAQGVARDKFMSGTKEATSGHVDLKAVEKYFEKSKKEAEEAISKRAESLGPQKALDRQKELQNIRKNIEEQAERKVRQTSSDPEMKEMKIKNEKEMNEMITEVEGKRKVEGESKTKLEKAKVELIKAEVTGNPELTGAARTAVEQATTELKNSSSNLQKAEIAITKYREFEKELKKEEEKVAEEMGITKAKLLDADGKPIIKDGEEQFISALEKIALEEKELEAKIIKGIDARNEYIKQVQKGNILTTLLRSGDRKKLVDKLRAQKGKYDPKDKNKIKKAMEELFGAEEKEKKEEKPEEKEKKE